MFAALSSPLHFYYSPKAFLFTFNLEPLIAALFWGPTNVYGQLQFGEERFRIYPLNQMFAIPTFKTPWKYILREFCYAWFIMILLTSFVYAFLPQQNGEF